MPFLCEEMSALVAEWRALVPPSNEPPVTPPPPKDHPKQVIEVNLVINLEKGDGGDDDLEQIDDPRGILDHQDQ